MVAIEMDMVRNLGLGTNVSRADQSDWGNTAGYIQQVMAIVV